MDSVTIALDAMGGDHGLRVVVPAALRILDKHENLRLILVGDQAQINRRVRKRRQLLSSGRLVVHHASEIVEMDESPASALRTKKDSSMRVAINLVKEGQAQACVSAGNTGALMATARFVLKMLPGIDRPAILSNFPTNVDRPVYILDLGANVDSSAENLCQFAIMGSIVAEASSKTGDSPRVALLNIGSEDIKGTDTVKAAAHTLTEKEVVNYIGYIEGNEFYKGKADVIVCDGFVGNVALKASEGTAKLILTALKQGFKRNFITKLCALLVLPVLGPIKRQMDPARYNGASLLGLQGIVIKSHGNTSILGFMHAIEEAILEVEKNVPQRISTKVEALLQSENNNIENLGSTDSTK